MCLKKYPTWQATMFIMNETLQPQYVFVSFYADSLADKFKGGKKKRENAMVLFLMKQNDYHFRAINFELQKHTKILTC